MNKRKVTLPVCLVVCTVVLAAGVASAANWPRFRGPNGAGVAADKDIPIKFDDKTGVLWKIALPGAGNSSPIIWNDRLFVQSGTPKERSLYCVSVKDGKLLWSRAAPGGQAKIHAMNTYASSSPATDGNIVVAAFWDGENQLLKAYDLDGNPKWERKLGALQERARPRRVAHPLQWQGLFLQRSRRLGGPSGL